MRRAEGGAKIFGVFRVKNHDFTPKNHIFSNFRGAARRERPPLDPPLRTTSDSNTHYKLNTQLHLMVEHKSMYRACMQIAKPLQFAAISKADDHLILMGVWGNYLLGRVRQSIFETIQYKKCIFLICCLSSYFLYFCWQYNEWFEMYKL